MAMGIAVTEIAATGIGSTAIGTTTTGMAAVTIGTDLRPWLGKLFGSRFEA
jgi:hypothetical protein